MPTMPPLVSTSSTRKVRASPKAWPFSQGVSGHGTRRRVVRIALIVMSVMVASGLPGLSRVLRLECQHGVDLCHHGGTFSDRSRDAFGRARANISDREYAGQAGLERQGRTANGIYAAGEVAAGEDEALVVYGNAVPEPGGVGIGADEEEQMSKRAGVNGPTGPVSQHRGIETVCAVAFQRHHLRADVQVHIRKS